MASGQVCDSISQLRKACLDDPNIGWWDGMCVAVGAKCVILDSRLLETNMVFQIELESGDRFWIPASMVTLIEEPLAVEKQPIQQQEPIIPKIQQQKVDAEEQFVSLAPTNLETSFDAVSDDPPKVATAVEPPIMNNNNNDDDDYDNKNSAVCSLGLLLQLRPDGYYDIIDLLQDFGGAVDIGDVLCAIDDESIHGRRQGEVSAALLGARGSDVAVTMVRMTPDMKKIIFRTTLKRECEGTDHLIGIAGKGKMFTALLGPNNNNNNDTFDANSVINSSNGGFYGGTALSFAQLQYLSSSRPLPKILQPPQPTPLTTPRGNPVQDILETSVPQPNHVQRSMDVEWEANGMMPLTSPKKDAVDDNDNNNKTTTTTTGGGGAAAAAAAMVAVHPKNMRGETVRAGQVNHGIVMDLIEGFHNSMTRVERFPDLGLGPSDFDAWVVDELLSKAGAGGFFTFKEYAPRVFLRLRKIFNVSSADVLEALTSFDIKAFGSPGMSKSTIFFSGDCRFIMKTIPKRERLTMIPLLSSFVSKLIAASNPQTLLPKLLGLYRIKNRWGKFYVMISNNLMYSSDEFHVVYDLKGTTNRRMSSKPGSVQNDASFVADAKYPICMDPPLRTKLLHTLHSDVNILANCGIYDYSLLVGLHEVRGNEGAIDNQADNVYPATRNGAPIRLHLGIIDVLRNWSVNSSFAATMSTIVRGKDISACPPPVYAQRLMNFLEQNIVPA